MFSRQSYSPFIAFVQVSAVCVETTVVVDTLGPAGKMPESWTVPVDARSRFYAGAFLTDSELS